MAIKTHEAAKKELEADLVAAKLACLKANEACAAAEGRVEEADFVAAKAVEDVRMHASRALEAQNIATHLRTESKKRPKGGSQSPAQELQRHRQFLTGVGAGVSAWVVLAVVLAGFGFRVARRIR